MPAESGTALLAYTPMFHSRLFTEQAHFRDEHFQPVKLKNTTDAEIKEEVPWLDGNLDHDRPLFVQFCANDPDVLLEAAQYVAPYCDAVDLNLGCPQGIAKRGNYGAFLQEDPDLIYRIINRLYQELPIPVTAKMRILDTKEETLDYAKMILSAGASIITIHGRQRHQKGHYAGLADWSVIRYLRDNLPPDTVLFANGNILQYEDIQRCLDATGVDGVMSAEGNLHNPAIFAPPPAVGDNVREYWQGKDGRGGWRVDGVMRRYLDIIYRHVLDQEPPTRKPLFILSDPPDEYVEPSVANEASADQREKQDDETPKQKKRRERSQNRVKKGGPGNRGPNFHPMQAHMFALLRPLVSIHTQIRDDLARCRGGDMASFEGVLRMVETVTKDALIEYDKSSEPTAPEEVSSLQQEVYDDPENSEGARKRCERPWWICQPHIRPLPKEAIEKGVMIISKKEREKLAAMGVQLPDTTKQKNEGKISGTKLQEEIINQNVQLQIDAAVSG
jgi:tRNA-dihydrouridine synthase 1